MGSIYYFIYSMDLATAGILFLMIILMWTAANGLVARNRTLSAVWRGINVGVLTVILCAILCYTLIFRTQVEVTVNLIPFGVVAMGRNNSEIYRSLMMNVLLFVPFGMCLPVVIGGRQRRNVLVTVVMALILSVSLELMQYLLALGQAEFDDVMCNVIGAFCGALSFYGYHLGCFTEKIYKNRG